MKSYKNILMGTTAVLLLATTALAEESTNSRSSSGGLFIEPAVTYEKGETDVNYPSPLSNSTGSSDGLGIGARFGFHIDEAFFVAADIRYSQPKFKDSSVDYSADSTSTNYGAVVGFQMPDLGLRVWGTYILGGELDPKADGSFDVKFSDAKGYRAGVGFRVQSVSLNLEYQDIKYGNATLEKAGPFSSVGVFDSVNLKNKSWIASVSFPIQF